MAYSDFTLTDVKEKLFLSLAEAENENLFSQIEGLDPSEHLKETLTYNVPLATSIHTEKARSELIVAPVLVEVIKRLNHQVSLFSGIELTVDKSKGLNGVCDYLISLSPEQLYVDVPVLAVVEAKHDNVKSGLSQCMSEMLAAKLFNESEGHQISNLYGVVTTGSLWNFLKLSDTTVWLDREEYHISNVSKILGIFVWMIHSNRKP